MRKVGIKAKMMIVAIAVALVCALAFAFGGAVRAQGAGGKQSSPQAGNYFLSDYESRAELKAASTDVYERIRDEGVVLLKNEDNALPLASGAKISAFGKATTQWGVFNASEYINAGFSVNPELRAFYSDAGRSGTGTANMEHGNYTLAGLPTGETPIDNLRGDEAAKSTYSQYSDAAVVYFSRSVAEGRDAPRTSLWDGSGEYKYTENSTEKLPGATSADDHYMELDANEKALLTHVCDNFEKVIVVITSGAQIETDFLDDTAYDGKIKAALWQGSANGSSGIPDILKGSVNPSGRTIDTWYRDFTKDPTWQNFGNNRTLDGNRYTNLTGGSDYTNRYVVYKEGIYVGYRYYETRGYEEKQADPSSKWYENNVNYPFGYGLSYTTFDWELVSASPTDGSAIGSDDTMTVTVKVTNTGDMAGKDVVQLYYTAPYTPGGIEKSYVTLGDFAKTDLLQPNESQELSITLTARDMASYDYSDANGNGFKGWELDEGKYTLRLMRDSHTEVLSVNYTVAQDITYPLDIEGRETDSNLFDDVSGYVTDSTEDGGLGERYMSRADFEGTFPTVAARLTATDKIVSGLSEWTNRPAEADEGQPYYTTEMPTTGEANGIVLSDLFGLDYDDPLWSGFLDQLTVSQLEQLATNGSYWSGIEIPALGIHKAVNTDGVGGLFLYGSIHVPVIGTASNQSWGSQVALAATFNKRLAYEKGRIIGNEGLWGGSNEYTTVPGYYAPGVNLHRSPFGGRTSQYFGEDGVLSGMMAAQLVIGAKEMGMFTYVKHFAINEQETNRIGVMTWANEQSMRELYFKPFELCVTEGKTTAMMSSLNRIGTTWAGGSRALLTDLLRDEWGFKGCVVTDSFIGGMSNADQMIRAGGNLALGTTDISYNKGTPTTVSALRDMAHGLLYMQANSMAINTGARPIVPPKMTTFNGTILPSGAIGAEYSASVATAMIDSDYADEVLPSDISYTLEAGSALPAGLTLSTNGDVTGVPQEKADNHRFRVTATIEDESLTATFTINITGGEPEIIFTADEPRLADAIVGRAYSADVSSAEIFAPNATEEDIAAFPEITYGLAAGSALPAGMRISSSGMITGTPVVAQGSVTFTVQAYADGMTSKSFSFTIAVLDGVTFGSKELATGRFGESYVDSVLPADSTGSVTYSLAEGSTLPNGLQLTAGGYIVGKPTQTVTDHKFTVVAASASGETAQAEYSVTIGISFGDNIVLPDATAGGEYSARVDMAQGAGTVTYALKSGSVLPDGLTLSPDGALSGTPTEAGAYEFTITASADGKLGDEITLTLYVAGSGAAAGGIADYGMIWFIVMICLAVIAVILLLILVFGRRSRPAPEPSAPSGGATAATITAVAVPFAEAYDALPDEKKNYMEEVRSYALSKEGAEERRTGSGIAIKAGARSAFMLRVRKGTPELSVRLENDMLRSERKEMGIPLKATVIKLRSEHDVRSACRLIDMAIEQRGREIEEARQRRRDRRRRASEQYNAPSEENDNGKS